MLAVISNSVVIRQCRSRSVLLETQNLILIQTDPCQMYMVVSSNFDLPYLSLDATIDKFTIWFFFLTDSIQDG